MKALALLFICLISTHVLAQDPTRFAGEIEVITNRDFERNNDQPLVFFTGSSSIRMWKNVETTFPGYQVINNGFGGSEFSDLIHYKQELIYAFEPDILFIYEGDNDVNSGKSKEEILKEAVSLLDDIKLKLPDTQVYMISPKPSISRWHLKDEYEQVNDALNQLTQSDEYPNVSFIDVWSPMLDDNGSVKDDVFIEDDLHMNEKGYEIWAAVIGEYLPEQ
ncbi:MAG: hypothetical protein JJ895_05380 [Balneolaceae bacterium]|nr:hypothetical protein [Balneolaceae bacterium]